MALSREKYKRIPDLYTLGTELVLEDGNVIYMAALNPLQKDEAHHDASVARARLVMALKSDHASDERAKVTAQFIQDGKDLAVLKLVNAKLNQNLVKLASQIQNDPDWTERLEILERSSDLLANPAEQSERELLEQLNNDYIAEFQRLQDIEREYETARLETMNDDELIAEYIELYLEHRGGEVAVAEYNLTEAWYAARCCEGVQIGETDWDHSRCENHQVQVYATKTEVRSLPEDLQLLFIRTMAQLNMSVRDARFSARQGSSSASSPLPSEAEASTRSTQDVTLSEPPGTSPQLSGTR